MSINSESSNRVEIPILENAIYPGNVLFYSLTVEHFAKKKSSVGKTIFKAD